MYKVATLFFIIIALCSCSESTKNDDEVFTDYNLFSNVEDIKVYIEGGQELPNDQWNESIKSQIDSIKYNTSISKIGLSDNNCRVYLQDGFATSKFNLLHDTIFISYDLTPYIPFATFKDDSIEVNSCAISLHMDTLKYSDELHRLDCNLDMIQFKNTKKIQEFGPLDTLIYYKANFIYKK